ncbi:PREDICTED: zinc finger protein 182-like [Dinoponera quadriceps]|uniref:Zinc finger protein 182-like n=1 Tax=Dinoponera quadriceps TaxID=609295 RepID=A0A6P3WWI3_DINQU|nr:PREDICTED: zinc finger protein 182-like [Dinoponera quadriceps]
MLFFAQENIQEHLEHVQDDPRYCLATSNGHLRYILLNCYKKIIKRLDPTQNILELSEESFDTRSNSLCELNRSKKIDVSPKLYKMIYTCPNCNIDLMIMITNNFEDNNYTFQISLASLDKTEQSMEEDTQAPENTIDHDNICELKASVIDEENDEMMSPSIVVNESISEVYKTSLATQEDDNCLDAFITFPNKKRRTSEDAEKDQENIIFAIDNDSDKLQELKVDATACKPDDDSLNSDHDGAGNLVKIESVSASASNLTNEVETGNEDDANGMMEIMSANDVMECTLDEEMDCKENDSTVYVTETERDGVDDDFGKCENAYIKRCPRIECKLCGTRYLSREKYEFHMERHKLNKTDRFICTICDKEASNESLLWDHYFHTHKSSVRHVCAICDKVFARKARLNTHQKKCKHSGSRELYCGPDTDETSVGRNVDLKQAPVNCSLCRNTITDINPKAINDLVTCAACEDSALSLMVNGIDMKMISPRQYHCSQCPKHFVHKERLEFHEMRHNENMNEFVCSTCGKEFRAENSLYEHYLFVHKGARPHICELCGKSFQLKVRLKEHLRTHTGEKPYQCDVCGQRCMTTNALRLHRKTHFSNNRYTCMLCDKSFSKKQNMNEHLEKHWKNNKNVLLPQVFTCPLCAEDLPTYRMLKYHMMQIHEIHHQDPLLTEQKPWHECNVCHEKFKHQMSLKAHKERVHEGRVSPIFECDICKASYKIKQMLINHIRSKHEGEKRYKCAQCHKGFNDTNSLYNHILLHTGRKPFQCDLCNMSFRRKETRDRHRRKHTDEQPAQDSDCGQTITVDNSRAKRRKKVRSEVKAECEKCPDCGEKCSSQQEIRMHLNKHLGEKLNNLQCM